MPVEMLQLGGALLNAAPVGGGDGAGERPGLCLAGFELRLELTDLLLEALTDLNFGHRYC